MAVGAPRRGLRVAGPVRAAPALGRLPGPHRGAQSATTRPQEYHGAACRPAAEVGDATYAQACNVAKGCPGSEFGDFGATDVWSRTAVNPADAVDRRPANSHTLVIFVRVGVEPADLPLPTA